MIVPSGIIMLVSYGIYVSDQPKPPEGALWLRFF